MGATSQKKIHICAGLLAHVDAGKTTLSEALLYQTKQIRSLGRVDHQDAYLDTDAQERERGITIFSKQARIVEGDLELVLLDTPGHVDFSAEMERTLQVLDYAILVISGTDGVQGHTRTLWRLLRHYHVPTLLFINKMDLAGANQENIQRQLRSELSDGCVDFSREWTEEFYEDIAVCKEELLNEYMENSVISQDAIADAVSERLLFPCFYGSALKLEGVQELWEGWKALMRQKEYQKDFSARVYKIGRDSRGARLTYLKVTGGSLKVKDRIMYEGLDEKIDQIRLYSGDKFDMTEEVQVGEICTVTGLTKTYPGQGIGAGEESRTPVLEPVLNYRIYLPKEVNPAEMLLKLKQLEEEDPQLHIVWNEELQEIHAQMMGQVQIEVLTRLIKDRFDVVVVFGQGNIVYKETIAAPVEGVGHFEPLRHYAEVHLLMEPADNGSGITVTSSCSEDVLDLNWQRLIATHVLEREHPGILTGSSITDIKFTIVTGRAHLKHTEGGDFRQATYRAIRQGLKSTQSVLLEPYYAFSLEIPVDCVGRAMTDLKQRFGKFDSPEYVTRECGDMALIRGTAPVSTMQDYMTEVHSYSKGMGHLQLDVSGYDVCHNSEEVIADRGYDSELDLANPTGSVFCAHGAGYVVPWDEVPGNMHMEWVYSPERLQALDNGVKSNLEQSYDAKEAGALAGNQKRESWSKSVSSMTSVELDAELADVYAREFGMNKTDLEEQERKKWMRKVEKPKPHTQKLDKKGNPIYPSKGPQKEFLIVDGYNIIFAWDELKGLSRMNIDSARDKLIDILSNYQGYKGCRLTVVFDAYKVKGNPGKREFYDGTGKKYSLKRDEKSKDDLKGIEVVYTRTDETADAFIERLVHEEGGKYKVTVATNDGLEQLTVMGQGALRMSARNLMEEIERTNHIGFEDRY